jgi:hypothetical protein
MAEKHPALERVWQAMRDRYADIAAQPLPVKFLVKLCELKERELLVTIDVLQRGDVVRLKAGSREMRVSKVLDTETVECTYEDDVRQVTVTAPVADVVKVDGSRDSTFKRHGPEKQSDAP